MLHSHLVEINELPPAKLCNFIDHKYYQPIRKLLETIAEYIEDWMEECKDSEKVDAVSVLFYKMKDEIEQLIRNDTLIIFPMIRNDRNVTPCKGRKLPLEMIQNKNKKIMHFLEKMKHQANGYIAESDWSHQYRILCDELYHLDQQVMQTIHLKENVLLPKVAMNFNQPCGKECEKE